MKHGIASTSLFALLMAVAASATAGATSQPSVFPSDAKAWLGAIQVPFVANQGQLDPRVAFSATTFVGTAFVTKDGSLVISLPAAQGDSHRPASRAKPGWTLVEKPLAAAALHAKGQDRAATKVSVFHGNDSSRWERELATYSQVEVGEPWKGVSLIYAAHGDNVERLFTLAPGVDVGVIRMKISGANDLAVMDGILHIKTGLGEVDLSRPQAYQLDAQGVEHDVAVRYILRGKGYGFRLGRHDIHRPVVIDPLIQATYLGGSHGERASALAMGSSGQVYVVGETFSTNFPGTTGGYQAACADSVGTCASGDVFVAELSGDLKTLTQATYLGGSGTDTAVALAIGSSGQVYVAGETQSTDFPGTTGGYQAACADAGGTCGWGDVFVAELSGDLKTLTQATYVGGSSIDSAHALAIGSSGQVYVAGLTYSTDFPGTTGGYQAACAGTCGNSDAFVTELSGDLKTLIQSTYLGGSGYDFANGLALGPSGQVYVAGNTASTDLPGTIGGYQAACADTGGTCIYSDGFVAELSGDLKTLTQATYLGGSGTDYAYALALSSSGQVYVAGQTQSTDFPGTTGGYQVACADPGPPLVGSGNECGDNGDAFVAELSGDLKTLTQATYLGGSSLDYAWALALGSSSQVYVAGETFSTNFPGTTGGYQAACADSVGTCASGDVFVAELSGDLKTLTQATYLGGSGSDFETALVLGSSGQVYVAGETQSADFPGSTGGYQAACADLGPCASGDGFIAEFSDLKAPIPPAANAGSISVNENGSGIGTLSGTAGNVGDTLTFSVVNPPSHGIVTITNATTGAFSYTPTAGYSGGDSFTFMVKDNQNNLASSNATESITVNAISSPPTASAGSFSVNENASATGTLGGTVGNTGDTLTFSVVNPPSHGIVTITNATTGAFSYRPTAGYSGSDSFMFKVTDNQNGLDSGNATESITVNAISSGGSTGGGGGAFDVFSLFILALLSTLVFLRIDERCH